MSEQSSRATSSWRDRLAQAVPLMIFAGFALLLLAGAYFAHLDALILGYPFEGKALPLFQSLEAGLPSWLANVLSPRAMSTFTGLTALLLACLAAWGWQSQSMLLLINSVCILCTLGSFTLARTATVEPLWLFAVLFWLLLLGWLWPRLKMAQRVQAHSPAETVTMAQVAWWQIFALGIISCLGWATFGWPLALFALGTLGLLIWNRPDDAHARANSHWNMWLRGRWVWQPLLASFLFTLLLLWPYFGPESWKAFFQNPPTLTLDASIAETHWSALRGWVYQVMMGTFPWLLFLPTLLIIWSRELFLPKSLRARRSAAERFNLWNPWDTLCFRLAYWGLICGVVLLLLAGVWLPPVFVWLPLTLGVISQLMQLGEQQASLRSSYLMPGRGGSNKGLRPSDWTFLAFVGLGLFSAYFVFALLPNEYPAHVWQLPGKPMLSLSETGQISGLLQVPQALPVWKLWLLPVPFLFLGAGLLLYILEAARAQRYRLWAISIWMVFYLVFSAQFALPSLAPDAAEALQASVNSVMAEDDVIMQVLPLNARPDKKHQSPFATVALDQLPTALGYAALRYQENPLQSQWFLITEADYYKLPFAVRSPLTPVRYFEGWQPLPGSWLTLWGGGSLDPLLENAGQPQPVWLLVRYQPGIYTNNLISSEAQE